MKKLSDLTLREKQDLYNTSRKLMEKYPNYYTIYCYSEIFDMKKTKYLVHGDMSFGQFAYLIRKNLKLDSHESLFFFVSGDILPKFSVPIKTIYMNHYDPEIRSLYVQILKENTFG